MRKKIRLFSKNANGYWDGIFEFHEGKEFYIVDIKVNEAESISELYRKVVERENIDIDEFNLLTNHLNSNGYVTFTFGRKGDYDFKPLGDFH